MADGWGQPRPIPVLPPTPVGSVPRASGPLRMRRYAMGPGSTGDQTQSSASGSALLVPVIKVSLSARLSTLAECVWQIPKLDLVWRDDRGMG